jgi:pimeloyl-ACP methyl ester carboxylesterase
VASMVLAAVAPAQTVTRSDAMVAGPPGIAIFLREVVGRSPAPNTAPLLLVHDTPAAGAASFDLAVAGGSLAVDLADAGLRVYLMDARGYGRSSRAPRLSSPPRPGVPLTRASEVVEDIGAVVDWIRQRTRAPKVALLGWGAGGHAIGQFAARRPDVVASVVFYNRSSTTPSTAGALSIRWSGRPRTWPTRRTRAASTARRSAPTASTTQRPS